MAVLFALKISKLVVVGSNWNRDLFEKGFLDIYVNLER